MKPRKPKNRNGELLVHGDPATQRRTADIPEDEAQPYGWVIERADGRTRRSNKHPEGQVRWVSKPERPVDLDTAVNELRRRQSADRERWERENSSSGRAYDGPTYRIRNVYTGAIVMGAVL